MSFRRFVYYCMLIGAWAAFIAWGLGRMVSAFAPQHGFWADILPALIYALFLGLTVAFGLSLVDSLSKFSPGQVVPIAMRIGAAVGIGLIGSTACGGLGGTIYYFMRGMGGFLSSIVFVFIWIALGLLVGLSVSLFDLLAGLARKDSRAGITKLVKCALGGTVGGVLGGILAWLLRLIGSWIGDPSGNDLWSPTALGFATLGGMIGLLVGLSQVVLLEAWVKVESGFRPGRDLILSRDRTVIGRAEGSDIALFGDTGVERQHAVILMERGGYFLEPLPNTPGTYINEIPVTARTPLRTGDLIQVGKSLLRFNQRRK